MKNLDRFLEKSRKLRECSEKVMDNPYPGRTRAVADNRDFCESMSERKDQMLSVAVEAMKSSIARADDYGDSHCSKSIREAVKQIEALAAKAFGEDES